MQHFKCRASKIGDLTTGFKKITATQVSRISELISERETLTNKNGNKVKWTDNKEEELITLYYLSANPQLGETAKTYLKEWVISQLTDKQKQVESKYFQHGIFAEDAAIQRAQKHFDCVFFNQQMSLENDFFTGKFDAANESLIIDVKCPWNEFTFPYFEKTPDKGYYGQLQIYMELAGINNSSLVFCLENHSDDEIDRLAQNMAYNDGLDEPNMHHWNAAKKELTYDHLPESMRIKTFNFVKDSNYIESAMDAVLMAREYITDTLLPHLK